MFEHTQTEADAIRERIKVSWSHRPIGDLGIRYAIYDLIRRDIDRLDAIEGRPPRKRSRSPWYVGNKSLHTARD